MKNSTTTFRLFLLLIKGLLNWLLSGMKKLLGMCYNKMCRQLFLEKEGAEMTVNMKKVVLLVEDNNDDVDLMLYALRKNNIYNEIVVVRDGVEALEYLFGEEGNGGSRVPELILLDLKLPRVNGLQVLERLRNNKRTQLVPVVVMTSSREDQDVNKTYSMGANSYIRKPVDFNEFVNSIKDVLHYWLVLNVLPEPQKG